MTDKLVKWLRRELPMGNDCIAPDYVCVAGDCPCDSANVLDAADRIETLEAALLFMVRNEMINEAIAKNQGHQYVNKGLDHAKQLLGLEKKND